MTSRDCRFCQESLSLFSHFLSFCHGRGERHWQTQRNGCHRLHLSPLPSKKRLVLANERGVGGSGGGGKSTFVFPCLSPLPLCDKTARKSRLFPLLPLCEKRDLLLLLSSPFCFALLYRRGKIMRVRRMTRKGKLGIPEPTTTTNHPTTVVGSTTATTTTDNDGVSSKFSPPPPPLPPLRFLRYMETVYYHHSSLHPLPLPFLLK